VTARDTQGNSYLIPDTCVYQDDFLFSPSPLLLK